MIITNDIYENVVDVLTMTEFMIIYNIKSKGAFDYIVNNKTKHKREKKFPKCYKVEKIERRKIDE